MECPWTFYMISRSQILYPLYFANVERGTETLNLHHQKSPYIDALRVKTEPPNSLPQVVF